MKIIILALFYLTVLTYERKPEHDDKVKHAKNNPISAPSDSDIENFVQFTNEIQFTKEFVDMDKNQTAKLKNLLESGKSILIEYVKKFPEHFLKLEKYIENLFYFCKFFDNKEDHKKIQLENIIQTIKNLKKELKDYQRMQKVKRNFLV